MWEIDYEPSWDESWSRRLPIRNLTTNQIEELRKDLKEMRLFNTKELV